MSDGTSDGTGVGTAAGAPESLGARIRRRRKELGLTLDELAGRTHVSKPYLSLIETGRVTNPPSDEKLRRLEHALGFAPGELVGQAHLQRTPRDVRAMLARLLRRESQSPADGNGSAKAGGDAGTPGVNLDAAYQAGLLHQLVDRRAGNVERVRVNAVPIVNKLSAGYPSDFTDLSYPPRVADTYMSCPDLDDADAFGCRVWGDSMTPKYNDGDYVVFSPRLTPRHGDDCFVRFDDGQTTFKRVFFEEADDSRGVIRLQPRNEAYRPQVVPAERVSGLYKAVYRLERVDGGLS